MASRKPNPRPGSRPSEPLKPPAGRQPVPPRDMSEPVDPIWLVKAFGVVVLLSLVCGYLSLCLLFYQGQWQLVLHPSRSTPAPTVLGGATIQIIRFGVDESATPQLTGWWIPAEPSGRYSAYTVLYLPSGDGSLADSDARTILAAIHSQGLNVFAFDYRGYGQSSATRPNQQRMTEDARSAWQYLTISRALSADKLVPFGSGVGAFLAAQLAAQHSEVPAVVLDSPRPDLLDVVLADPRVKSLPVRALFHNRFDIAELLASLTPAKLVLITDVPAAGASDMRRDGASSGPSARQLQSLTEKTRSPKMIVHLTPADRTGAVYPQQLSSFLDLYLH